MLINILKSKSSIEWCENNYIISEYIAEFWNSFSGITLIMSGILYYYNNKKWIKNNNEIKFEKITKLLCVIGCGTILFHGSLLYIFQLLDEIPMILLVREYISILLMLKTTKKCISENTCKNIIKFTNNIYEYIFMIMYSYLLNKKLQIVLFHLTFKILEIRLLIILYNLSKSLNKIVYDDITKNYNELYKPLPLQCLNNEDMIGALNIVQYNIKKYADLRKKIKRAIRIGITFYSLSMCLWILENRFCNYTQKYQFHALWHVFSSIGVYYLNDIIKYHIEINKFIMY